MIVETITTNILYDWLLKCMKHPKRENKIDDLLLLKHCFKTFQVFSQHLQDFGSYINLKRQVS